MLSRGLQLEAVPLPIFRTDQERLVDLQRMLDDPSVRAILCGRGGYGTGRIIEQIDFTKFLQYPKWIIGYSDITVLHAHIHRHHQIVTLHAPMATAFNGEGWKNEYIQSLHEALEGISSACSGPDHAFNRSGAATAPLVGGNLALLAHLVGTSSDLDTAGKILFIEEWESNCTILTACFINTNEAESCKPLLD